MKESISATKDLARSKLTDNIEPGAASHMLKLLRSRVFISRLTGMPVSWEEGRAHKRLPGSNLLENVCVATQLSGDPTFYAIANGQDGKMIIMSDGKITRYIWLGMTTQNAKYMATVYKATNSMEEALELFSLAVAQRQPFAHIEWLRIMFRSVMFNFLNPPKEEAKEQPAE